MAKRLTDSRKWDDPWFTELSNTEKLTWIYMLDKCDYTGFFKPNIKLLNFQLDLDFTKETLLRVFKGRVQVLSDEKWFIPKFISFQYGLLSDSDFHNKIKRILKDNRVSTGCRQGVNTPKNKNKDKEEVKNKDKYKEYVLLTKKEYDKLLNIFGEETTGSYIQRLNNYIGSKGKRYKSHYHTILTWADKDKKPELTGAQLKTKASFERLDKNLEEK